MSAASAAAPRRAAVLCGGRADGDVAAAQMLLEYQDKCARLHMRTRPRSFKALRGMLLSAITGLTLRCSPPGLGHSPAARANSDGDAFGAAGRRARACLGRAVVVVVGGVDREASWPVNRL